MSAIRARLGSVGAGKRREAARAQESEAQREKVFAAEQRLAMVRLAVIALNSLIYFSLARVQALPELAIAVMASSAAYSLIVVLFEPYRRLPLLSQGLFTSVADGVFITLWLASTGGFASPFYPLWYVSIAAVAFRFGYRHTTLAALLYALSYAAMVAAMGQLPGHVAELALRLGYVFFVGVVGAAAAHEAFTQVLARIRLGEQMRTVQETEAKFRAVAEHARDAIVSLDSHGRIVYFNPHAEEIFGVEAGRVLDQQLEQLLAAPSRGAWTALRQRALSDAPPLQPVELVGLHSAGSETPLEVSMAPWKTNGEQFLTVIARDVGERKRSQARLEYESLHDDLTGLPNRTLLRDRLGQAIRAAGRGGQAAAVLAIDLDRFKEVNDVFGHHRGDALLRQVGARLQAALRKSDTIARGGGDEFTVLLSGFRDMDEVIGVVEKLLATFKRPFAVEEQSLTIAASLGAALYPEHGEDGATLLRLADVAMYATKRAGGGYQVYTPERDEATVASMALASELRQAIDGGELRLHYQPKVNIITRTGARVEALVRWAHPRLGLLGPDQFIPLAEQNGLIRPLTRWVLAEALAQCRAWHDASLDISVAVNLSVRDLQDPRLPETIHALVSRHQVDPSWLRLEVTESMIMADLVQAPRSVRELRNLGLRLSIDDFGTGYSSLAYLKQLPVDELKIDKSFVIGMVSDDADAVIVRSTIDLAHNLGLKVVAEGVESSDAWDMLASLGCDAAQGYYLGRPMPAQELERWVRESPWGLGRPPR